MAKLKLNAEVQVKSLNFNVQDNGDKNIHASLGLYVPGTDEVVESFNVHCTQPKSDTKAVENFLEAHLVSLGIYES